MGVPKKFAYLFWEFFWTYPPIFDYGEFKCAITFP
jgi:hypothetical protein